MDEQRDSGRQTAGHHGTTLAASAEGWRELGFPSEEDLFDWLENHRATQLRSWLGAGLRAASFVCAAGSWPD